MGKIVKLDTYSYMVLPGKILIELDSLSDPTLVDIFSEIENSNGRVYVEGEYYYFLGEYEVLEKEGIVGEGYWLELSVVGMD